jgi:hypothetical protein
MQEAFRNGADCVVLSAVPLAASELELSAAEMAGTDALVWLQRAPWPLRIGPDATRAVAIALWRHSWLALREVRALQSTRALVVELSVRVHRAGLERRFRRLDAVAGGLRSGGWAAAQGWAAAHWPTD